MSDKHHLEMLNRLSKPNGAFVTTDGVTLRYRLKGRGASLILLHGWSQSAAMFAHQLESLSDKYRVIALDFRGHGESDKPLSGLRIARLAQDVRELMGHLHLERAHLLGWSMGASVAWSFVDLFGTSAIEKLILVDQPSMLTIWPWMTSTERDEAGALFTMQQIEALSKGLLSPDGETMRANFVNGMVTKAISPDLLHWIMSENAKTPLAVATALLWSHCAQDWRDILPRIDRPTLVIAGEVSHVNPKSQYFIKGQIAGARLHEFTSSEGGAHFMFLEAPQTFNAVCTGFLSGDWVAR